MWQAASRKQRFKPEELWWLSRCTGLGRLCKTPTSLKAQHILAETCPDTFEQALNIKGLVSSTIQFLTENSQPSSKSKLQASHLALPVHLLLALMLSLRLFAITGELLAASASRFGSTVWTERLTIKNTVQSCQSSLILHGKPCIRAAVYQAPCCQELRKKKKNYTVRRQNGSLWTYSKPEAAALDITRSY